MAPPCLSQSVGAPDKSTDTSCREIAVYRRLFRGSPESAQVRLSRLDRAA